MMTDENEKKTDAKKKEASTVQLLTVIVENQSWITDDWFIEAFDKPTMVIANQSLFASLI